MGVMRAIGITQSELKMWLTYYPDTGKFIWNVSGGPSFNRPTEGTEAGTITRGRRVIRILGRGHFASRLAWLYMTGESPTMDIDHINRDKSDDRWCNLRHVNHSQNCMNKGPINHA